MNQPRLIDLRCDKPGCRIWCAGYHSIWLAELHPVEQVEDLAAEFQIEPLRYRRLLEQRKIIIRNTGSSEDRIGLTFATQRVGGRNGKARNVKPAIEARLGRTAQYRIAAWHDIWTQT